VPSAAVIVSLAIMSQENLEIVRQAYADPAGVSGSARVDPDAEFDFTSLYPDQPILRGVEAIRRFSEGGPWGRSISFEPERLFDVDEQRVVAVVRATAAGQSSGTPVSTRIAHEFTLRGGVIVHVRVHRDADAALRSLGLAG
jgi:ketosteroid isomerase-like protein